MFQNSRPNPPPQPAVSDDFYSSDQTYYPNLQPPAAPTSAPAIGSARRPSSSSSVRRRTSRACDQCNQLRTRCDGKLPCKHCVETQLPCKYARLPKKRGKLSKKELAEKEASETVRQPYPNQSAAPSPFPTGLVPSQGTNRSTPTSWDDPPLPSNVGQMDNTRDVSSNPATYKSASGAPQPANTLPQIPQTSAASASSSIQPHFKSESVQNYRIMSSKLDPSRITEQDAGATGGSRPFQAGDTSQDMSYSYNQDPYNLNNMLRLPQDMNFLMEASSLLDFESSQRAGSLSTSSGVTSLTPGSAPSSKSKLKYPVLLPLVPHIKNILPASLACELLEHYFQSSSSSYPRPASPYLLGFVFSRRSFLTTQNPRQCSPALLASMLWIATQTSNARLLTKPASARDRLSQKLFNLTIALLKPPIHGPGAGKYWPEPEANFRSSASTSGELLDVSLSPTAIHGTLDDVAAYIHIAIVSSAGESKGGSLRWWYAAWTLARELKLGQEVEPSQQHDDFLDEDTETEQDVHSTHHEDDRSKPISEESREERRRVWWLLYVVDRHLALCYNRPVMLLDRECQGVLRPMDEQAWHSGDFDDRHHSSAFFPGSMEYRLEFTGPGIFGYFLPLMTILGEIVDLQNARRHPLSQYAFGNQEWDQALQQAIFNRLEIYEASMRRFESQHLPPVSVSTRGESEQMVSHRQMQLSETQIHLKIAIAYSTHVLHVLHILLTGKWDPVSLLDDEDNWISSPSFLTAIHHAVAGAEAVTDILHYDPEINFMPFLYGIYLLQGSFLLLLMADQLQAEAIPNVVSACETIVRAHEACVVTLSTEYQRAFRKVMQSALSQARGRAPADAAEQQKRRRDTLALYRWTNEGTGLAT